MRYRSIALPPEHGGWGLLFEPILVGLMAAPSRAGILVAIAAIGVFLARQPIKILLTDLLARRRVPRTAPALAFAAGYLTLAAAAGLSAWSIAGSGLLIPVTAALPLALVQVGFDARNRSRALLAEVCGAAALAASAAAIGVVRGWSAGAAAALWTVAAARTVPAMVTVRTRVLRLHGEHASATAPVMAQALAVMTGWYLYLGGATPLIAAVYAVLAARAVFSLRPSAPRVRPQRIGIEELAVGLLSAGILGVLMRG